MRPNDSALACRGPTQQSAGFLQQPTAWSVGTDMPRRLDGNIQLTRLESFTACMYLVWPDKAARTKLYYTALSLAGASRKQCVREMIPEAPS